MNNRQRAMAILNYEDFDRLPLVHFAFWDETVLKWVREGHLTSAQGRDYNLVGRMLGFDFDWFENVAMPVHGMNPLFPPFEPKVVEEMEDGSRKVLDGYGAITLKKADATGIPHEFDHTLKDRKSWEEHYVHRLQVTPERVNMALMESLKDDSDRDEPIGLYCGSLIGEIRNCLGIVGLSYLQVDDAELMDEIVDTFAEVCYKIVEQSLASGAKFDYAHYWEDICYKNGPLISPRFFREKIGPHYRRISELLWAHDIHIVSLDCDGKIDALVPTWVENGVNTMFPIEVGTWKASIVPWREQFGRELRGVGGMDKKVFAYDYAAVDAEIERLKPLVDLGGFIPCPDHRIPLDAKWENVQYYCDRMRTVFG